MAELTVLFEDHDKNWSWFEDHYEELVKKFDGEFVAVHEQRVVDYDRDVSALMKRIEAKYSADRVFVDFVSSEKLTLIL